MTDSATDTTCSVPAFTHHPWSQYYSFLCNNYYYCVHNHTYRWELISGMGTRLKVHKHNVNGQCPISWVYMLHYAVCVTLLYNVATAWELVNSIHPIAPVWAQRMPISLWDLHGYYWPFQVACPGAYAHAHESCSWHMPPTTDDLYRSVLVLSGNERSYAHAQTFRMDKQPEKVSRHYTLVHGFCFFNPLPPVKTAKEAETMY